MSPFVFKHRHPRPNQYKTNILATIFPTQQIHFLQSGILPASCRREGDTWNQVQTKSMSLQETSGMNLTLYFYLREQVYKHSCVSICLSICVSFTNFFFPSQSVNETSSEASLAPVSCTVEYRQLYMCTRPYWVVQLGPNPFDLLLKLRQVLFENHTSYFRTRSTD